MAFSATAALIAAGSEATAAMVIAAVAEVGTYMTVAGLVTGDKTLTKVGGAMSLVGGIGGMINSAASAGSVASSAASGAEGTVGAAPDMLPDAIDAGGGFNPATGMGDAATADAAAQGGGIIANAVADPAAAVADGTSNITDASATAPADATTTVTSDGTQGTVSSTQGATGDATVFPGDTNNPYSAQTAQQGATPAGAGSVQTPMSAPGQMQTTAVQTPAGNTSALGSNAAITNPTDARLAAGMQTTPMAPISSSGYFGRMMGVLQDPKNKTMLELGSKLVGGALQGAESQSQFNAKMDLENRRLAQTSYGSQVAQNRPHGIIAGARK